MRQRDLLRVARRRLQINNNQDTSGTPAVAN
jgi:hypothetical protein